MKLKPNFHCFFSITKYFFLQNNFRCSPFLHPLSVLYIYQLCHQSGSLSSFLLSYFDILSDEKKQSEYPFFSFCKTMQQETHLAFDPSSIEFVRSFVVKPTLCLRSWIASAGVLYSCVSVSSRSAEKGFGERLLEYLSKFSANVCSAFCDCWIQNRIQNSPYFRDNEKNKKGGVMDLLRPSVSRDISLNIF